MTFKSRIANLTSGKKAASGASALGGMVVGALVGIGVQAGVDTTGILGPTVDTLIAEQDQNFDAINSQLESLMILADGADVGQGLAELQELLKVQAQLQSQSTEQMALLAGEVSSLRETSLVDRGFAGGADVWLGPGESVTVGTKRNVVGVTRVWAAAADVNMNGEKSRISVGGLLDVDDAGCTVFLKQGRRPEDGRAGFDVVCS